MLTWAGSAGDKGGVLIAQLVEEVGSVLKVGCKLVEEHAAEECGRAQSWVLCMRNHKLTIRCIRQSRCGHGAF